jgi:hypothetical protein
MSLCDAIIGINYEKLIRKYIDHVRQAEGIDFIDRIGESFIRM